jgi:hypothetical protein
MTGILRYPPPSIAGRGRDGWRITTADGTMRRGKLGAGMSTEEGYPNVRQAGLVLIAAIKDALDGVEGWSRCWAWSTP